MTAPVDNDCGPFSGDVELASAAFGQGSTQVTPVQMAMVAAAIAGDGVMPQPWVVRDVRRHSERNRMSDSVVQTFGSPGGTRVVSSQAAAATRAAMVDAVNAELGRLFAGQGDITLYGISNHRSAGKTGTAQLGGDQAPHSWFIGFAPAEDEATPEIAIAVLVESGGSGMRASRPDRGTGHGEYLRLTGGGRRGGAREHVAFVPLRGNGASQAPCRQGPQGEVTCQRKRGNDRQMSTSVQRRPERS